MREITATIILLLIITSCELTNNPDVTEKVVRPKLPDTLYSAIVDDGYRLYTSLPKGYNHIEPGGYDVIYVLDGDALTFGTDTYLNDVNGVVGMADSLSDAGLIPPCIVIGIGYTDVGMRFRDYYSPPDTMYEEYGHAWDFYNFLRDELFPLSDVTLNTKGNLGRTIVGTSAGGYFVLHAFLRYDENEGVVINNFIASTPRVAHFDYHLLNELDDYLVRNSNPNPNKIVYTFGDHGGEMLPEQIDVFSIPFESHGFITNQIRYVNENHGSVVRPSVIDGLQWLFNSTQIIPL